MKIFDISPAIDDYTPVFPGDTPFKRKVALSFDKKDHLELSSMETTLHIGAHADAPSHYHPEGESIEKRDLSRYVGPCQLIDLHELSIRCRIYPDHLGSIEIKSSRILFRTDSFDHESPKFTKDFNSLSPELIEFLTAKGVILIGIDTPSVDPSDSKKLESHQSLFKHDVAVLEGLDLKVMSSGLYFLSAAPLKLKGAEAAPTRAILIADFV